MAGPRPVLVRRSGPVIMVSAHPRRVVTSAVASEERAEPDAISPDLFQVRPIGGRGESLTTWLHRRIACLLRSV